MKFKEAPDPINYKEELINYQSEVRTKLVDIQKRMMQLSSDILDLSIYVQSGIFYNCITELGEKKINNEHK